MPSICGRAERWSEKKRLSASGRYFGWTCMSRRQPTSASVPKARAMRLLFDIVDPLGTELVHERARLHQVEHRIRGFNDQEEAVARCMRHEFRNIEYRMIRFRQTVHREHANDGRKRR